MIDIAGKGAEWIGRWQQVTFSPAALFGGEGFRLDSTAFLFSTGCLFLGYFSAILSSVAYFAVYYPRNLRTHLAGDKLKSSLEVLTIVAGVYIVAFLLALLVTASVSYLIFRRFGATRPFEDHFAAEIHVFSLEPVAAVALTIYILCLTDHHPLLSGITFAIFVATRFYYLWLAFVALKAVHRFSSRTMRAAFLLGYIPPAFGGMVMQIGLVWMLGVLSTTNWD
jgi:hypothetical protein